MQAYTQSPHTYIVSSTWAFTLDICVCVCVCLCVCVCVRVHCTAEINLARFYLQGEGGDIAPCDTLVRVILTWSDWSAMQEFLFIEFLLSSVQ